MWRVEGSQSAGARRSGRVVEHLDAFAQEEESRLDAFVAEGGRDGLQVGNRLGSKVRVRTPR